MSEVIIPTDIRQDWEDAILRGMEFLDTYLGEDWVTRIDIERLDLNNTTTCVCGQLFDEQGRQTVDRYDYGITGYDYAVKYVLEHGVPYHTDIEMEPAKYFGFNLDEGTDEFDSVEQRICDANGVTNQHQLWSKFDVTVWDLFTEMWATYIEKAKADRGVMA